ncbi:hypothetical protein A374_07071 [Fictibacillus macauensis ZFHKF-1]|uniref:Uncharacterized protein n=1 Tax=Fictibacillus macauensis ZFHKF-1 TaxID=1196324 RepID=I8AJU3_9BACL|nr:CDP-glycerol glycerophosphotransferase family protein [Fictibacillus macauensis]EIT86062.1 hypothetical protein A374_07071 [Fictibacillus macauensis ZFHKF-1]
MKNRHGRFSFSHVSWNGEDIVITLPKKVEFIQEYVSLFVMERKKAMPVEVEYVFISSEEKGDQLRISFEQFAHLPQGRWDFYIKKGLFDGAQMRRLGLYETAVSPQKMRYLKPFYYVEEAVAGVPYVTEKNGLSLHIDSVLQLEREGYDILSLPTGLCQVDVQDETMAITLPYPLQGSEDEVKIVCKNERDISFLPYERSANRQVLTVDLQGKEMATVFLEITKGQLIERYPLSLDAEIESIEVPFTVKGQLPSRHLFVTANSIVFDLNTADLAHCEEFDFFLSKRKSDDEVPLAFTKLTYQGQTRIMLDVEPLKEHIQQSGRWDVFIRMYHGAICEVRRIGNHKALSGLPDQDEEPPYIPLSDTLGLSPYFTVKNELTFYMCTNEQYVNSLYPAKATLQKLTMSQQGEITLSANVKMDEAYIIEGLVLRHRQNKEQTVMIPCKVEVVEDDNERRLSAVFHVKRLPLEQFYWDFYVSVLLHNGTKRFIRLRNGSLVTYRKLKNAVFNHNLHTTDEHVIYPYITVNNCVSLTYRRVGEHETLRDKMREYIAYMLSILCLWYFRWQPVWLVHEKYSETAQDNSFYFFKYMYEKHPKQKVYYVIKKGSADERHLTPYKRRVVYFMSIKHLFLLLGSKLIVSSETKGHGYAWRVSQGPIRNTLNKKRFVFLQHGVLGLKKVENTFKVGTANGANLFVVSSDFEKDIVVNYFGYEEENVIVTGLSRWDVLEDQSQQTKQKEIFLMPTWRNWLEEVDDEQFVQSSYFHEYNKLISSPKLTSLLEQYDVKLNFYVHPKFMPYVQSFTSTNERISVIQFGEVNVNELLMRSSLLITDYSSVAWETYYQKKPVLFFHFDVDQYEENQGAYMNLKDELFGEVAYESDDLVSRLEQYIVQDFAENPIFAQKREHYFNYVDHHNSARIYQEIKQQERKLYASASLWQSLKRNYFVKHVWEKYKNNRLVYRMGRGIYEKLHS